MDNKAWEKTVDLIAEVHLDIERLYDIVSSPRKKQLNISQKIEVLTKAVLELNEEIEELKKSQKESNNKENKADNNRKMVEGFDDLLNSKEAANLVNVKESTIQAWARSEKIPAGKVGRKWTFSKRELLAWMEKKRSCVNKVWKKRKKP